MKKKREPVQFVAALFLVIIFTFMCSILLRVFTKNILVEKIGMNNGFTKLVLAGMNTSDALDEVTGEFYNDINWEEQYPFAVKQTEEAINSKNGQDKKRKLNDLVNKVKNVVNDYCNEYLVGRTQLVEKAYSYEKMFGWSLIPNGSENGIIIKEDGYLTYVQDKIDEREMIQQLADFHGYLADKKIPFLYVQAPSKINPLTPDLPAGVDDFTNENIDNLLKGLEDNRIDYLDLREYVLENFEHYEEAFYKTDHHWKTTTAFEAVKVLTGYLNEKYGYQFSESLYDADNYNIAFYEKYFLGSQGKKVTLSIAEPEDYELVEPLFATDFTIQIPERDIDIRGTFGDTLLDYRHLQEIDYYGENCYASFMNRNDAYANIRNESITCNNKKKILIIKDSYSTPFIPYLALDVEEIDAIYPLLFDGSIRTLVEKEEPDMVIVLYAPNSFSSSAGQHTDFFNFE